MLLYIIQVHQEPEQVRHLVELLDDGSPCYLINVDPAARTVFDGFLASLPDGIRQRVTVRSGLPVTWGGMSQVHAWLDAYSYAVGHLSGWRFVVILSGSCIPLVPQATVRTFLKDQEDAGVRVHLGWWDWEARGELFHAAPIGQHRDADVAPSELSLGGGLPALVEAELRPVFEDRQRSPIFHAHWRGAVHCTDLMLEKRLVIRRLLPAEILARRRKMQAFPSKGGWLWCILRRDAIEAILVDPILPDVLDMLTHFICPDELFLHTIIHNSAAFRDKPIGRRSSHFLQGLATDIGDGHVEELERSGAFFARKVDYARSPRLLDYVKARVSQPA